MDIKTLIQVFGGLALFLFAINFMGDGLKAAAGNKLRDIIKKATKNTFMSVALGIVVTILVQSSSASTALAIGLVSAGLMSFRSAVGVILGANIGTTVTAYIVGLPIKDYVFVPIIVGVAIILVLKSQNKKAIGQALLGFGLMFIGMNAMGDALKVMAKEVWFSEAILNASTNPILGFVTSTGLTVLVQSSSATTGILVTMVSNGLITMKGAIPMIIGANVGTTITAVIVALAGSKSAKRTAFVHVLFNISAGILALALLVPFTDLMASIQSKTGADDKLTVAFAHTIFNVSGVLLVVWFIPKIEKLAYKVFKKETGEDTQLITLDYSLINASPAMALEDAKITVAAMAKMALEEIEILEKFIAKDESVDFNKITASNNQIEGAFAETLKYLRTLATAKLDQGQIGEYQALVLGCKDIERIADYAFDVATHINQFRLERASMTPEAKGDLITMILVCKDMMKLMIHMLTSYNIQDAMKIKALSERVDGMELAARQAHVERLSTNKCANSEKINYQKMLQEVGRIAGHINNVGRFFRPSEKLQTTKGISDAQSGIIQ